MKSISKAVVTMLVGATAAWAQRPATSLATQAARSNSRTVMATNNATGLAQYQKAQSVMHQRVEDMGNMLAKMHTLLKQMQATNKQATTKNPMAKPNLEMWGLMLQDLDKQYEQLRIATRGGEEMGARRAALYKQAEAKAAAEAQGVQAPGFARAPVTGRTDAASGTPDLITTQPPSATTEAPAGPKASSPSSPN